MKFLEMLLTIIIWLALQNSLQNQEERQTAAVCASQSVEAVSLSYTENRTGESEAGENTVTESDTESESSTEESSETESESGTEESSETESESGTEESSETESESGTEESSETESESGTEESSETESESGTEESSETESETDSEEPETETESKQIRIQKLWADYEDGYKIYDGTTLVNVAVEAEGVPAGYILSAIGRTELPDAGSYPVKVEYTLTGEEAKSYEIVEEAEPLEIRVMPKPLTIVIADGTKRYYEEPVPEKVQFPEGEEPIRVEGFLEETVPEGFQLPEWEIDREVIQKDSPMYRDGKTVEYEQAIVVKRDEEGKPTGNPTDNYCFLLDREAGFYFPGSIRLKPAAVTGTLDFTIHAVSEDGICRDGDGVIWVRPGTVLQAVPQKGRGYTHGTAMLPFYQSQTAEFKLVRKNKKGELLAESLRQKISCQVDPDAPEGGFSLDGTAAEKGAHIYRNQEIRCSLISLTDRGSGIRSAVCCAVNSAQADGKTAEEVWQLYSGNRDHGSEVTITEEGTWRLYARLEDRVGNIRFLEGPEAVLDKTGPQILIEGVLPGSANNGTVEPVITAQDPGYQKGSLEVVLEGKAVGQKTFSQTRKEVTDGESISVGDIPRERRWDDLYLLTATAQDMAGNRTEKKIFFSVNRFGSVYIVQNQGMDYYRQEPRDLIIYEINVDTVSESKIRIGHGETVQVLKKGIDYQVKESRNRYGWSEYRYRIPAARFREEGAYYVTLFSVDRANNTGDSRQQNLKLEFAVDRTPPSVFLSGIEEGKSYPQEERTVVVECRDNQKLAKVQVFLNDLPVYEGTEGTLRIRAEKMETWQKLSVCVRDGAGNEKDTGTIRFFVGDPETAVRTQKEESETGESAEKEEAEREEETEQGEEEERREKQKTGSREQTVETKKTKEAAGVEAAEQKVERETNPKKSPMEKNGRKWPEIFWLMGILPVIWILFRFFSARIKG